MSCVDLDPKRRPIGTAKKGRTPRLAKEKMISWRRWRLAVSINRSRETGRFGLGSDRDLSCLGSDRTWLGGGSTCLGSDRTWPRWRFDLPRQRSDVPRWRFVFASTAIGRGLGGGSSCLGSDRTCLGGDSSLPRQRSDVPRWRFVFASAAIGRGLGGGSTCLDSERSCPRSECSRLLHEAQLPQEALVDLSRRRNEGFVAVLRQGPRR